MAFSTKLKLTDAKSEQQSGSTLTLSGNTRVADSGDMRYVTHPIFIDDTEIIDKKYVDDLVASGTSASTTYDLSTPSTVDVGGLDAGSTLTGKTSNELLEEILVPYLVPTMTNFQMVGQSTTIEVGTTVSGSKTFSWGFTNTGNVAANTLDVIDVGTGNLLTDISTTSPSSSVTINSISFSSNNQQHQWRGEADDTQAAVFGDDFTVTSIHPYFWGIESSGGAAAGVNRPTATNSLVTGGTKVVGSSTGTVTITFNSTSDDYIWFAIPTTSTSKTKWYVDALNTGAIGGAVSAAGNLFPAFDSVTITTVMWAGVSYKVYISNYQTAATSAMQLRNS